MTTKRYIKTGLLISLIALGLGGFLLHLRVHPFAKNPSNFIPFFSGILSIIIVPLLFSNKKSISFGYVLNGMLVIIGTITMAHIAIVHLPHPFTIGDLFFKTTLADILLLWGKFFVGKSLFDLEFYPYTDDRVKKGNSWRYPNYGWWLVHMVLISFVYFAGKFLWR